VRAEGLGYIPPTWNWLRGACLEVGVPLEAAAEACLLARRGPAIFEAYVRTHGDQPESLEALRAYFERALVNNPEYYTDYYSIEDVAGRTRFGDWLALPVTILDPAGVVRVGGFQLRSCLPKAVIGMGNRYRTPAPSPGLSWKDSTRGLAEATAVIAAGGSIVLVEGAFDRYAMKAAFAHDPTTAVIELSGAGVAGRGDVRGRRGDAHARRRAAAGALVALEGAGRVIMATDQDVAGHEAVVHVGAALSGIGLDVAVAHWDGAVAKDPGELLEKTNLETLREAVHRATPWTEAVVPIVRDHSAPPAMWGTHWARSRFATEISKLLPLIDDRAATALRALLAAMPGVRGALSADHVTRLQDAAAATPATTAPATTAPAAPPAAPRQGSGPRTVAGGRAPATPTR
jgi:hypothetical protein